MRAKDSRSHFGAAWAGWGFMYRLPLFLIAACGWLPCSLFAQVGDPDPARFEEQIAELVERDRVAPPSDGAILCIGSSSMRMWSPRLAEDLAPLSVVPLGFGGSHFSDALHYFDELIGSYRPRAVLLYEGDNDIASGKTPIRVARDFLSLVVRIHSQDPAIRVYVISVKPSPKRAGVWPDAARANSLMKAICEEDYRLIFVDVATALLNDNGEAIEDYFVEDGIHLNEKGYDQWARAVRHVLIPPERAFEES